MKNQLPVATPVTIARPGTKHHGWKGKVVEHQEGEPAAWVGFTATPKKDFPTATSATDLRRCEKVLRFPLSQLQTETT